MSAPGPRAGQLGQVRQVGQLAEARSGSPRPDRCRASTPRRSPRRTSCSSVTAVTLHPPRGTVGGRRGRMSGHGRAYRSDRRRADLAGHLRCSWTRVTAGRDGAAGRLPRPDVGGRRAGGRRAGHGGQPQRAAGSGSRSPRCGSGPGRRRPCSGCRPRSCATGGCRWASCGPAAAGWRGGSTTRPTGSPCWRARSGAGSPTRRRPTRSPSRSAGRLAAAGPGPVGRAGRAGPGCPSGSCTAAAWPRSGTGRRRWTGCCGCSASSPSGGREPGAGLARLAADAGYADQAHLGHDCRALADATPRAQLR